MSSADLPLTPIQMEFELPGCHVSRSLYRVMVGVFAFCLPLYPPEGLPTSRS